MGSVRTLHPIRLAAAICVATTVAMVGAVGVAAAPAVTGASTNTSTTITLNVTGCEGCVISASQFRKKDADSPSGGVYSSKDVTVTNGVAVLQVPTARTSGMYFLIQTPRPARIDAQPLITTQVRGFRAGTTLTRAQQIAGARASACWAGTSQPAVTLGVTVNRVLMPSFPNAKKKTSVPLARFSPTLKAPGGFGPAYKGVLATQDVWPCE
jgi:hypothetical protein